jgi:hypothetical protein
MLHKIEPTRHRGDARTACAGDDPDYFWDWLKNFRLGAGWSLRVGIR